MEEEKEKFIRDILQEMKKKHKTHIPISEIQFWFGQAYQNGKAEGEKIGHSTGYEIGLDEYHRKRGQ